MRNAALFVALAILAPALALASGGGEHAPAHGPDWGAIVRHTVNLVILIGLLWTFLKRPVGDFLLFRRNEVKEQLETSSQLKAQAEARYAELQERLANFDDELRTMMDAVASEAAAEQKRLLALSERSAAQIVAAARTTVGEELRRARVTLHAETAELALGMATTALTAGVGAADQDRLNADYLLQVERSVTR